MAEKGCAVCEDRIVPGLHTGQRMCGECTRIDRLLRRKKSAVCRAYHIYKVEFGLQMLDSWEVCLVNTLTFLAFYCLAERGYRMACYSVSCLRHWWRVQ